MKKISLVPLVCLVATTIFAQDKTADIDKIFSWTTPTAPGCVCAVAQNGKIIFKVNLSDQILLDFSGNAQVNMGWGGKSHPGDNN